MLMKNEYGKLQYGKWVRRILEYVTHGSKNQ